MAEANPRLRWCAIATIAIALGAAATPAAVHALRGDTGDFTHFWRAAGAMLRGGDIYQATQGRYVYPPLFAFVLQPLAALPEPIAAFVWLICNLSILLAALILAARGIVRQWNLDCAYTFVIVAGAIVLNFDKIRALLNLGQTDSLILLGFGAALFVDSCAVVGGFAIGAAANLKYLSLIFVPYLLLTRRFRAAIAAVGSFALLLLLPAIELGLGRTIEYLNAAFAGVTRMFGARLVSGRADVFDVAWNRSVSLTSAIFRFAHARSLGNATAAIVVLVLFGLVLVALLAVRRRRDLVLDVATLAVLALLFSPQTTARHFVLITVVYEAVIGFLLTTTDQRARWIVAGGTALLIGGLTLPFGTRTSEAVWRWREIGGSSWCALIFLLVLNWLGARQLAASQAGAVPSPPAKH